jgi:hypothetical protein
LTKSKARGFPPRKKDRPVSLQAAGKTISSKNASGLIAARDSIASGLVSLTEVLDSAGLTDGEEVSAASDWENSGLIECNTFEDYMRRSLWYGKLQSVLDTFSYFFEAALYYESEDGTADDFYGSSDELIDSLTMFLKELKESYSATLSYFSSVQAFAADSNTELITFTVPSLTFVEASKHPNRLPIEGMLFQCDTVSEGIPAKGPGKRLMIPRSVALAAIDQVPTLPLDADPTLKKHCNNSIVGTMLGARIKDDNGFWISGNLFPWSQPEIVSDIRASKNKMGFSINAYTRGHDEEINSENVHVIDELILVGANILYADHATFSQTRLVSAAIDCTTKTTQKQLEKPAELLTATITEEDLIMEETLKQLTAAIQGQAEIQKNQATVQSTILESLSLLLEDRQQRLQAAAIEQEAALTKQREEELIERVAGLLGAKLPSFGRSVPPARLVPAVVQASGAESIEVTNLARLEGELKGLQATGSTMPDVMQRRIQITDQIAALSRKISAT